MDRFEAMSMFLAAIEGGSFSAAARDMQVPVPTLSRKVANLESRLGIQLFIRSSRKLALTDAGITYAKAARQILEQLDDAEREAVGEFSAPRGELVIAAPILFGRLHVLPIVSDFLALFPEVDVRLALGDRTVNLVDDNIDMALRIGTLPDSGMIVTRVGSMRSVVCASPSLLDRSGVPRTPEEMTLRPCLATELQMRSLTWPFRLSPTGTEMNIPIHPRLGTSADAVVDAALRGIGFARLRYYQVFEAVKDGKLRVVLENYETGPAPVHLLHATRGHMPLKMRRFLDFAAPRLRKTLAAINSSA